MLALMSRAPPLVRAARAFGVSDEAVLRAVAEIDRGDFVPPAARHRADRDAPIRIPHGQVTSQPSLIAGMVEALGLSGDEHVLEVGTGLGYQTALLARLADSVVSIERFADLAEQARTNLQAAGVEGVQVLVGDGTEGAPAHAPFDGIVISAAFDHVPGPLAAQLVEGGRLVQPVGPGGHERVICFVKRDGGLTEDHEVSPASFVRLVGRHGFPD